MCAAPATRVSNAAPKRVAVVGVLLAAGQSRRMGEPKQLLPLLDGTVLSVLLTSLLASSLDDVAVVLPGKGQGTDAMQQICAPFGVTTVVNPDPTSQMADSLRLGVRTVTEKSAPNGVLIALCDQPLVGVGVICELTAAFRNHPESIVLPTWEGQRGHPVIIPVAYLTALSADQTLRDLVHAHAERIREIPASTAAVLDCLDTPDDYQSLCARTNP